MAVTHPETKETAGNALPHARRGGYLEERSTKAIEKAAVRIPSDAFLFASIAAMAASAVLQVVGKRRQSLFVGQWVPTILILGLYNKLVKVAGHEGEAWSAESAAKA